MKNLNDYQCKALSVEEISAIDGGGFLIVGLGILVGLGIAYITR